MPASDGIQAVENVATCDLLENELALKVKKNPCVLYDLDSNSIGIILKYTCRDGFSGPVRLVACNFNAGNVKSDRLGHRVEFDRAPNEAVFFTRLISFGMYGAIFVV